MSRKLVYTVVMFIFSVYILAGCRQRENDSDTVDTSQMEGTAATVIEISELIPDTKTEETKTTVETTQVEATKPEIMTEAETAEEEFWMTERIEAIPKERVMEVLSVWNHDGSSNSFLIPDSDTRFLTAEELSGYTNTELRLIRNEIAARHGWDFKDPILHAYFITQQWYTPRYDQNDSIAFNETEKANMELLDQLESGPEKEQSSLTRREFIELDFYKDYEIAFDDYQTTLRLTNHPDEQAWFPNAEIIYDGQTVSVFDEGCHVGLYSTHSAKLYNLPHKSFLFLSGNTGENDWEATFRYVLTKDDIEKVGFSGSDDMEPGISTSNSFCSHARTMLVGFMYLYDWFGLNTEDGKVKVLGKSAIAWGEEELTRPLTCYIVDENSITERVLEKGEVIRFETFDSRQYLETEAQMLGISLQTGETAYVPLFNNEDGYYLYSQDGIALVDHFDRSSFSWAG